MVIACTASEPTVERGEPTTEDGKTDSAQTGSCSTATESYCGGQSAGSCHCDDRCADYHDCCADAAASCGVESNRLEDPTAGMQPTHTAEVFAALPYPPGNVATSNGRVFVSFFPDSNKGDFKVAEIVNGQARAFPADMSIQNNLNAVLGIRADKQGRLWILDHGTIGLHTPKLVAIDIATQKMLLAYSFKSTEAGFGSLINDVVISPDGGFLYISDLSPLAKKPAVIVVDVRGTQPIVKRRLEKHASVVSGKYDTFVDNREFKVKGIRVSHGIDGIAIDASGANVYYAAVNGGELYRVSTAELRGTGAPTPVKVADITQTDGIITDAQGRVYISDMEHYQIVRVGTNGALEVIARDSKLRWPDGFAWLDDSTLLVTASALHTFLPKLIVTEAHIASNGPYHVFRIRL